MKASSIILAVSLGLAACGSTGGQFADLKVGMTKQEVLDRVGEPSKKNDLALAEFWVYDEADRTVAFRADTVFDIMTSASARIDSIETGIEDAGRKIGDKLRATGDTIERQSKELRDSL